MSTATENDALAMVADPTLLGAVVSSVQSCLTMCQIEARCVGVSAIPLSDPGNITGMIGVHGNSSGFVTVNLSDKVAQRAVGGLLDDDFDSVTPQVIDGTGEITNIIGGGIKSALSGTPWAFSHVTVPSVIIGQNYKIAYSSGLAYVAATFEHQAGDVVMLDERLIQVAISLIRL